MSAVTDPQTNTPSGPQSQPTGLRRMSTRAWIITALLVLFQIVAFADKAVLGLVAPQAMSELGMSAVQFGFIGSAFFFLYAVVSIVAGFLASRFSVKWILLVMGVVWAVTQVPMLLGGGAAVLLVTRIILGGAEGPATAMSLTSAHGWFPPKQRALPSNLIAAGSTLGPVVAAPVLAWVILTWGWRSAFGFLAIIGFIWVVAWLLFGADGPFAGSGKAARAKAAEAAEAPALPESATATDAPVDEATRVDRYRPVKVGAALLNLTFLAAVIGGFSNFWVQGFLTTWLPNYLGAVIGLPLQQVGVVTTFPWLIGAGVLLLLGLIGQRLLKRGRSVQAAISVPFGIAAIIAGVAFLTVPHTSGMVAVALLSIAGGCSLAYPMTASALGYVVGPKQRPILMATLGGVASIGAIVSPTLVGWLMSKAGYVAAPKGQPITPAMADAMATGVNQAFTITGIVLLIGGVMAALFLRPGPTGRRLQRNHLIDKSAA
ncbi:MFS transporter [Granulicoccus phenolivorans]|uniref:MFS transporter n=1 Tax=Granulicoccus phenolivorans TaxID=266854 RepID=UPI00047B7D06|nr:MFS transporter [Granulicoccus phenolivorans]